MKVLSVLPERHSGAGANRAGVGEVLHEWEVSMKHRNLVLFGVVAAVIAVASVSMAGQARQVTNGPEAAATSWTQPRTAWGIPTFRASG